MEKIAQGAEAILYKTDNQIIKDRISKDYRIKQIDDKLRKSRTKLEAKLISAASRTGVKTPNIIEQKKTKLILEFIDGIKVRDWLDAEKDKTQIKNVCKKIGNSVKKLHHIDVIHGDLTTSNMIKRNNEVVFIDFGLGARSQRIEDKAVDLHLFKECLKSKHYKIWKICWKAFKESYKHKKVFEQLKKVESRGRYKSKFS
ncbi:Kae1-associated serine/threonine protein kinase [Candidatus Woesearchaeota archaeon]|nr:Kae1-associated serine/threonine protein kinase [Candidatus Woesearchaeota archaeon]